MPNIPKKQIHNFVNYLKLVKKTGNVRKIFVVGCGGSNANAQHLACDLVNKGFKAEAICSAPEITAAANDFGVNHMFSEILEKKMCQYDILICLSGSGNSKCIINANRTAITKQVDTVAITSSLQGELRKEVCWLLPIKSKNMEEIEDMQLLIIHEIKRCL